jgi:hypothetical protein
MEGEGRCECPFLARAIVTFARFNCVDTAAGIWAALAAIPQAAVNVWVPPLADFNLTSRRP